jgi:chemotaxis protein CheD
VTDVRVRVADLAAATEGTLTTLGLGSCVAIALHDPVARVGGLAHILLPDITMARDRSNPAKFPSTAVPALVIRMTALGAQTARIRAKIVGGASMFASLLPRNGLNVGERNVAAARAALSAAGIDLVGEEVGADHGRNVVLYVDDGRVEVRSLKKGTRVF